jgi:predicted nucleic acid-binding protein
VIAFADSSALVSHYDPTETDVLPSLPTIVVSAIARVEVVSGLWRKARASNISAVRARVPIQTFEADWAPSGSTVPKYRRVAVDAAVLERASAIVAVHGLRSLDAIQLASAIAARDAEPECRTMVVLDERLRNAAAAEGFDILPV